MNTYKISNATTDMGEYKGTCKADALRAMHEDAGYQGVTVLYGDLYFEDPETEAICGGMDTWAVEPVDTDRRIEMADRYGIAIHGDYITYTDDADGEDYRGPVADLDDLAACEDEHGPVAAYSHWCSQTSHTKISGAPARVEMRVPRSDLAEIDNAAEAAGVTRTEYVTTAALARARGRLEVPEALAVVEQALRDAGVI